MLLLGGVSMQTPTSRGNFVGAVVADEPLTNRLD